MVRSPVVSNLSFLVSGDNYFDSKMPPRLSRKTVKNKEVRQRNKLSSHCILLLEYSVSIFI